MKLKKIIFIVVIVALLFVGYRTWSDKPYCTVEIQDEHTVHGKKNAVMYLISKIFSQRRELLGNDPYKMYVYINDPDGIDMIRLTVDGNEVPAKIENPTTFEDELNGITDIGLHHYKLMVRDKKGNMAQAESYIKVSPVASAMGVGI